MILISFSLTSQLIPSGSSEIRENYFNLVKFVGKSYLKEQQERKKDVKRDETLWIVIYHFFKAERILREKCK